MLDKRYPNLCRLEDTPGLHPGDRARVRRYGDAVFARTNFRVALNRETGCLFFYLGTPDSGEPLAGAAVPWSMAKWQMRSGEFNWHRMDTAALDDMVRFLQTGRAPMSTKERQVEYAKRAAESDERLARERGRTELERAVGKARKRVKNRWGMRAKARLSAVVDGTKGVV